MINGEEFCGSMTTDRNSISHSHRRPAATRSRGVYAAVLAALFLATAACSNLGSTAKSSVSNAMSVASMGVFSLHGEEVPVLDVNFESKGTARANQTLVRYMIPEATNARPPVVLLPGFALSADIYLQTPDGRQGWALEFLRAGHPVYLVEPAKTSRAGIDPSVVNFGRSGTAEDEHWLFSWDQQTAWRRFGFGPSFGEPFSDGQLDPASYQNLVDMFTQVMIPGPGGRQMLNDSVAPTVGGLEELLERIGPAVVLVHSASGLPGFRIAAKHPDLVQAVINIEPVGCPGKSADSFPDVPVLSVFGDHFEVREQMTRRKSACQQLVDNLNGRAIPAEMLSLPDLGIHGNSHLPMSEINSSEIAQLMIDWLATLP